MYAVFTYRRKKDRRHFSGTQQSARTTVENTLGVFRRLKKTIKKGREYALSVLRKC